jgi:hypothetical protein
MDANISWMETSSMRSIIQNIRFKYKRDRKNGFSRVYTAKVFQEKADKGPRTKRDPPGGFIVWTAAAYWNQSLGVLSLFAQDVT